MVALWALAQKYAEQWLLWLVVDLVCTVLYIYKQIHFTAGLCLLHRHGCPGLPPMAQKNPLHC